MSSRFIWQLRQALRGDKQLHGLYMRLKRRFTAQLVGMTSKTEQDFCTRYGRDGYTGSGEVVDLGCWLGSTTISLARGLKDNRAFLDPPRKIHAFDLFVWYEWMNESLAGTDLLGRYSEGDSFLEEFEERVSEYAAFIDVHEGDLAKIGWIDKPIEFLLVDAMKNWELANAIVHDFYSHLIPGKGLLMHQDFAFFLVPWIHVIKWKFRDHFEIFADVPHSATLVFQMIEPIPSSMLGDRFSYASFSRQDLDAAYEYFLPLVSEEKRPKVAAAKVMWFLERDLISEAVEEFDSLIQGGVPVKNEMLAVKKMLDTRTLMG